MLSGVGYDIISKLALSFVSGTELDPSSCCIEAFLFRFRDLIMVGRRCDLVQTRDYPNIQQVEGILWFCYFDR